MTLGQTLLVFAFCIALLAGYILFEMAVDPRRWRRLFVRHRTAREEQRKALLEASLAPATRRFLPLMWQPDRLGSHLQEILLMPENEIRSLVEALAHRYADDLFRHRLTSAFLILDCVSHGVRTRTWERLIDRVGCELLLTYWWEIHPKCQSWFQECRKPAEDQTVANIANVLDRILSLDVNVPPQAMKSYRFFNWSLHTRLLVVPFRGMLTYRKPLRDALLQLVQAVPIQRQGLHTFKGAYAADRAVFVCGRLRPQIRQDTALTQSLLNILQTAEPPASAVVRAIKPEGSSNNFPAVRAAIEGLRYYDEREENPAAGDDQLHLNPDVAASAEQTLDEVISGTHPGPGHALAVSFGRGQLRPSEQNLLKILGAIENRDLMRAYSEDEQRECREHLIEMASWRWRSFGKAAVNRFMLPVFQRVLLDPMADNRVRLKILDSISTLGVGDAAESEEWVRFLQEIVLGRVVLNINTRYGGGPADVKRAAVDALVAIGESSSNVGIRVLFEDGSDDWRRDDRAKIVSTWKSELSVNDSLVHELLRFALRGRPARVGLLCSSASDEPFKGRASSDDWWDIIARIMTIGNVRLFTQRGRWQWGRVADLELEAEPCLNDLDGPFDTRRHLPEVRPSETATQSDESMIRELAAQVNREGTAATREGAALQSSRDAGVVLGNWLTYCATSEGAQKWVRRRLKTLAEIDRVVFDVPLEGGDSEPDVVRVLRALQHSLVTDPDLAEPELIIRAAGLLVGANAVRPRFLNE